MMDVVEGGCWKGVGTHIAICKQGTNKNGNEIGTRGGNIDVHDSPPMPLVGLKRSARKGDCKISNGRGSQATREDSTGPQRRY